MSIPTSENRRTAYKVLAAVFAVLGTWWGGGMVVTLIQGFAEHDGYHRRELEEALPMLSLFTAIGIGFLVVAWFFWRAARRRVTHRA